MNSSSNEGPPRNDMDAITLDQTPSSGMAYECSENKDHSDNTSVKPGKYTAAIPAYDGKNRVNRTFYSPSMVDVKSKNRNRENKRHRKNGP